MKKKRGKFSLPKLAICLVIVYAVAFIGGLLTSTSVNSEWYTSNKPDITPPGFLFPIVWNILYFLIALSIYFVWGKDKKKTFILFGINLALNLVWSFFFFTLKNPLAGFITIIVLWLSILSLLIFTWTKNRVSFWLLILYFAWVSFASVLNYLFI